MNIEELGQKNRAIPGWLRLLVVAPFLALATYWTFWYHGLYKWLAEVQMDLFDGYYLTLTGAITYLVLLIPVFPIFRLLRRKYDKPPTAQAPSKLKLLEKYYPHVFKRVIVTGAIAAIAIIVGSYMLLSSAFSGEKSTIHLSDLKSGSVASTYVEFEAGYMSPRTFGMVESHRGTETSTVYVPVFNSLLERMTGDFYCIVEFYEDTYNSVVIDKDGPISLEGTLSKNSLPGLVREQMKNKLGDNYWVLKYDHSPQKDADFGWIMTVVGLIFGVIFIFVYRKAMHRVDGPLN